MGRKATCATVTVICGIALGGVAQGATVHPVSKDFGSQPVGTTSPSFSVGLVNSANICTGSYEPGSSTCSPSTAYATDTSALGGGFDATVTMGDFVIHNNNCPYPTFLSPPANPSIPTVGACVFLASFAPTSAGAKSLTLSFPDTGGPTAVLTLTGNQPTGDQPTGATFELKAAIRRCKKKFPKGPKRTKCIKRARKKAAALS